MKRSTADSPGLFQRLASLGESPWFWGVLLINGAIVGLLLIAPKYGRRQAVLERRYEARREIALRQATGKALPDPSAAPADPGTSDRELPAHELPERELIVPPWRLLVVLLVLDVAALAAFVWHRRRADSRLIQLHGGGT